MDPIITFHAIERILAIAIGGVSIVLGYRLFLAVPALNDSGGGFRMPWNVSVALTRVGPGVFFALYGAAIVGYSLHGAIDVTSRVEPSKNGPSVVTEEIHETGAMPAMAENGANLNDRRMRLGMDMAFLGDLERLVRANLGDDEKRELRYRLASVRLRLMKTVWDKDWGDQIAFRDWAEGGAKDPVPPGIEKAASYFRKGEGGAQ